MEHPCGGHVTNSRSSHHRRALLLQIFWRNYSSNFFFVVSYLGFLSFFYKIGQCCLIITDVIHVNKAEKGLMLVWQRPTVLFDDCDCRKYRRRRLFIETFVLVLAWRDMLTTRTAIKCTGLSIFQQLQSKTFWRIIFNFQNSRLAATNISVIASGAGTLQHDVWPGNAVKLWAIWVFWKCCLFAKISRTREKAIG